VTHVDFGCGPLKRGPLGLDLDVDSAADIFADVHHLPLRDQVLTTSSCYQTLEHVVDPVNALKEIRRTTRGLIVLSIPNVMKATGCRRWRDQGKLSGDPTHLFGWTLREFTNILNFVGLEVEGVSFVTWSHTHRRPAEESRVDSSSMIVRTRRQT